MTDAEPVLLVATHARDAGYDLVLLAHVLSAFVGLGAVVVAGTSAWTLRRAGLASDTIRRYYRPGANWAGRALFLIPVLGLALMALSHGDYRFSEGWIMTGLALWAVVAVVAEMYLWPAERRLQEAVAAAGYPDGTAVPASTAVPATSSAPDGTSAPEGVAAPATLSTDLPSLCLQVAAVAACLAAVLIAAGILMVAQP